MSKTQIFEIEDIHIASSKFLYFKVINPKNSISEKISSPISIPFGSIPPRELDKKHKFFIEFDGSNIISLFVVPNAKNSERINILPVYKSEEKVDTDLFGKVDVRVEELLNDYDRMRAMQIIMRSHYLYPPQRGLYLGCWLTNPKQMKEIRSKNRNKKNDFWSDAWDEAINEDGRMVGCAVLDTLFHGIPNGRKKIVEDEKITGLLNASGDWINADSKTIVDKLGLAWVSRFAVDEPYRNLNLGSLLAKHLVKVAYSYRLPRASHIEVITTEPTEKAEERIKNGKSSFLGQAKYKLDPVKMPSRRMLTTDENGNKTLFIPAKKLYYYIKTEPNGRKK